MTIESKKVGVFGGDLFWTNLPYEVLNYYEKIKSHSEKSSLILFSNDIRLNKKFQGVEKFRFDPNLYKNCRDLIVVKDWAEFFSLSKDYDEIHTSCKISPKTRPPENILKNVSCDMVAWDTGGVDVLVDSQKSANKWRVKGQAWKDYLLKAPRSNMSEEDIVLSECPLYERYYEKNILFGPLLSKKEFFQKYSLSSQAKSVVITPSNPGSHREMFSSNLKVLREVTKFFLEKGFNILIKTYPHDYLFYESESKYSGIYKRKNFLDGSKPQYEFLKDHLSDERIKILESQDHHESILYSEAVYNMSGSSISWETYFSKCISFSIGLKRQKFYKNLSYLPGAYFPDEEFNFDFESVEVFKEKFDDLINLSPKKIDKKTERFFISKGFNE